ncbi:MAG TPA: sensor domain-containing diguanylate cyclase [Solirubrobacteraceae bacterium]|nr:sensor domain-containing diguanylate cyclase [Solirubrobacteraceae bacterium]
MGIDAITNLKRPLRVLAPFSAATVLAWTVALVGATVSWPQYGLSVALAFAGGILAVLAMLRHPRIRLGATPGALVFLAAVAVLRNSVGGTNSGASAVAMIPVFYTALYSRSRRDLAIVVAGVGIFYLAPILIVGPPTYPHTQYRAAVLSVAVSTIVGFATQQLVASVRTQATQARGRERMLEELTDVVYRLFDSARPRVDVCRAATSISGATVALLYEPDGDGRLGCTAMTGIEAPGAGADAQPGSAVVEAFRSGRPVLGTDDLEAGVGSTELWIAARRPHTVLFQPLLRHGVALGVLVVGWAEAVRAADPRTTVAALLAHEAAAVIARADAMDNLAGEAQTDPLTGLANRRAWDAQLQRALSSDGQVAIAMLDFDHFKHFNDTHGHPAGDRLLKETAAAWRDQVRGGDLLARLGGEEFGLLLRTRDATTALDVTERLRCLVSGGWTCSAGVAVAQPGEDAEAVVARADRALYEAKARGRDRIHLTPVV